MVKSCADLRWIIMIGLVGSVMQMNAQRSVELEQLHLNTVHSGESDLFVDTSGTFYLSWIEYLDDTTDVLQFALLRPGTDHWSQPQEIARGHNWFVNWADFPAILGSEDGQHIASHWLQKSADGTYDYDIMFTQSQDGGKNWSVPISPHKDKVQAEHGFVSMDYTSEGEVFLSWLDGRKTKQATDNAMTLRSAQLTRDGVLSDETELDARVCDCCQTSVTYSDQGPIVVYRDRTEDEVRDIGIIRALDGIWQPARKLHDDQWKIAGCPVNGPAIAHLGSTVAVAWYTMDNEGNAKVNVVFSTDSGSSFTPPLRVDVGQPIGRVDIVVTGPGQGIVSWMEEGAELAAIMIREVTAEGKLGPAETITHNTAARASGFPRLAYHQGRLVMSYSAVSDTERKQVKTLVIK